MYALGEQQNNNFKTFYALLWLFLKKYFENFQKMLRKTQIPRIQSVLEMKFHVDFQDAKIWVVGSFVKKIQIVAKHMLHWPKNVVNVIYVKNYGWIWQDHQLNHLLNHQLNLQLLKKPQCEVLFILQVWRHTWIHNRSSYWWRYWINSE